MTQDEEMWLRELAAERCVIPQVTARLGPMSLWSKDGLEAEIRRAVEAEREACAKEADKRLHDYTMLTSNPPQSGAAWSIASAIRARGQA
jgi:hypothetical protein